MDFTTPLFLFFFLPMVLCGYWVIPPKFRLFLLLGISLFFYAWGEGKYVVVLATAIVANYLLSLAIDRCQQPSRRLRFLFGTIALNLAFLFAFKYQF
jgi:alginate O-acetyltransferase complex protein AlgI